MVLTVSLHGLLTLLGYILYLAVVLTTVFFVILGNRNPVRTIAWIVVLLFLPLVGLLFYFFFGRDTRKERLISKKGYSRLNRRPLMAYQEQMSSGGTGCSSLPSPAIFFSKVSHAFPFGGNQVDVYTDGYSMFQALIRDISCARRHIHLQFYIFENDGLGRLLRDLLIDKAREGVKIRLLYDDVGCWNVDSSFFELMLCEGIEVQSFLKVRFPRFTSKVNYRNHRKLAVIDGKIGYIGGMNVAARYLKGFSWGVWRDTHVRIQGKGVYGIQTSFLADWFAVDCSLLTAEEYFPKISDSGEEVVQIVTSDPVGEWHELMQGIVKAVCSARHYLYIQSPYFLPTDEVMNALQTAALSGVDVRVMLPRKADSPLTQLGTSSYLDELMRAGVKVYLYRKGFLHSKILVADDEWSSVGSTNMDFRSFEHNFEANAFFYSPAMASHLKNIFLSDQEHCVLLSRKLWARRSGNSKVLESLVRLLAPLL